MAQHEHEHAEEDTYGIALGFRLLEDDGKLYLAEAEISPYIDAPEELGVTLVFHPLDGVNPIESEEEVNWPSWPLDIDDDLARDSGESMEKQFAAIIRQLRALSEDQLMTYLQQAREESEEAEEEEEEE